MFNGLELTLARGEVLAVTGPSGTGKSSLLKLIYGTYRAGAGRIELCIAAASSTSRRRRRGSSAISAATPSAR